MNLRLSTALATLGCVLLASCYPYDENKNKKATQKQAPKTVTTAEQQKLKEQRERIKEKQDLADREAPTDPATETPPTSTGDAATTPTVEKRADYPVAMKAPGKEGYVLSPFNNKLIDVKGMPTGTLVSDPTYPESAKKFFRVP